MIPTDATDSSGSTSEELTNNSMSGLFVGGSEKRMPGGTQGGFSGGGGRP